MSYDEDTHEYVCDHCGRRFPEAYPAFPDWRGKMYGKEQYLRLAARSNFRRHVLACKKKTAKDKQ